LDTPQPQSDRTTLTAHASAKAKEVQANPRRRHHCTTFAFAPTHSRQSTHVDKYFSLHLLKYSELYSFALFAKTATMNKKNVNIKKDRFKNVAAKRVQKVLDSMDSLSRCANRNNYEYSDEDVSKLLKAIKEQMRTLELAFTEKSKTKSKTFSF
jgi:hypothetical protein